MECPECRGLNLAVVDSRGADNDGTPFNYVRRRRKCIDCDSRFTTYELTEKELERMKAGEKDLRRKLLEVLTSP